MADAIGKDNEVARSIKQLARLKKLTGKLRLEKLMAGAAGAVKNQHGVRDAALRVTCGFAERRIMQPQLRQRFSRPKFEILDCEIALRTVECRRYLGKRSPTGEQRANAGDQEEAQFLEHGHLARARIYHIVAWLTATCARRCPVLAFAHMD